MAKPNIVTMNRNLDRLKKAMASNGLSGVEVTSARGKTALELLLSNSIDPDADLNDTRQKFKDSLTAK